jgi:fibronectin type 3 domain-containing protein
MVLAGAEAAAQHGSNLGSYAAPYRPPAITGTVTSTGGAPVADARVETPDGHFTSTATDGAFALVVDVPGLYTVKVSGSGVTLAPVEVSVGAGGATQDFVLDVGPAALPAVAVPLRFDFGTASSPLAAGYQRISEATAYGGATGFGWSAGARASRNRGTGGELGRDFVFCAACTFLVTVPDGDYLLRLLVGDTAAAHDRMSFTAEGVALETLATAAGQVVERGYRVTIADRQLTLEVADLGGADANAVLNALELVPLWPRVYDFGVPSSPVGDEAFRVTDATAYSAALGYGWLSGTRQARDRATGDDFSRDFVFTPLATFAIDVPAGTYEVAALLGDAAAAHDQMGLYLEGAKADAATTAAGAFTLRSYTVHVADGQLTILLDDLGGSDGNVVINGLRVEPAAPLKLDFGTAASPVAAGWSRGGAGTVYDTVRGYGWVAGAVQDRDRGGSDPLRRDLSFTPDATFRADVAAGVWDVVLTAGDSAAAHDDIAVILEGAQRDLLSPARNQFLERTYRVVAADGDLRLRLDDAGGSDPNAVINALCVLPACGFRYDFGTAASPMEAGYTRVTEATTYAASVGYGWTSGVLASRDRGSETALRRDLVFTALGVFAIDLPNGLYDVVLTLGDRSAAHDQMGVFLEGVQIAAPSTAAGAFTEVRSRIAVADGQLNLGLDDLGGADAFVAVNALAVTCAGRYDFGTASSPLAPGWVRVAGDAFSAAAGWGWTSGAVATRDRAAGDDVARDLNFTALATFEAVVPDGEYAVTMTFADAAGAHDLMGVFLEGAKVDTVDLAAGESTIRTYFVTVSDGRLTVTLDDLGGKDANVVINGLVIRRT